MLAQVNLGRSLTGLEDLAVRVGDDEVDTGDAVRDHRVDGVAATAADAHDLDDRALGVVCLVVEFNHVGRLPSEIDHTGRHGPPIFYFFRRTLGAPPPIGAGMPTYRPDLVAFRGPKSSAMGDVRGAGAGADGLPGVTAHKWTFLASRRVAGPTSRRTASAGRLRREGDPMTRARTLATAFLAVGLTIVALAPRTAAAAAPDEKLNDEGVELRRKGDDRGALEAFQKAYDMTHSPRATAQIGLVYQALGRWELAGPLVEKALQTPGDSWVKKYQPQLQDALSTIRQHLARIELTGEPAGAEVIVNGAPAGKLPLPGPLTVSIGTVDLQVRAEGYQTDIRKITLGAYQYEHVFIRLDKLPEARPVAVAQPAADEAHATTTTPPPPPPSHQPEAASPGVAPRSVVKWSALGVGAAGIATGVVATIQ